MQQDIADLNNILTKHQQSIDGIINWFLIYSIDDFKSFMPICIAALSNDLTDHMNATKKLITGMLLSQINLIIVSVIIGNLKLLQR